ncbi:YdcF family protein [Nitrosospira multiformis]|nr:YdcF family protein [Nitrosospira multiformis]
MTLVAAALALLYLLSTPIVADALLQVLEAPPKKNPLGDMQAIIVLGGGTYYYAPEYGDHTVGRYTLERVRYAAKMYRLTGKPMLTAGGAPLGNRSSEAMQMKAVLEEEFLVPVEWVEETSSNTRENAYKSFAILQKQGIRQIALVTHAWHMPRAAREFEQAGFEVTPAATGYTRRYKTELLTFLPDAGALLKSSLFFHEVIGMLWYRLTPVPD